MHYQNLTKKEAIELAGSPTALAEIFGITLGAISHWDEEIPEGRLWQLRVLRPGWFKKAKEKKEAK
ncbi:MAG: Cro/Cl family transcriptional regulator [Desulfurellales bacterium]|nr:MAG: Cro/Cl family transcriptional regulator [Desulfurellales bacterium]